MGKRDEMAARNHKSKVDSSSIQVANAEMAKFLIKGVFVNGPYERVRANENKGGCHVGLRHRVTWGVGEKVGYGFVRLLWVLGLGRNGPWSLGNFHQRKHVSDSSSYDDSSSSEEENVLKKRVSKKNGQVNDESSSSEDEDEKPLKNKKRSKHVKNLNKKKKKPLIAELIKKIEYLDDLPSLRSRTVPFSLFAVIHDFQVDMELFLSDIGFSSLHNVYIDTLPHRFARCLVRGFSASSYEFKLKKGIIRVTPEKVHKILGVPLDTLPHRFARCLVRGFSASSYEFKLKNGIIRVTPEKVHKILGVPLGETSISDLPEIPLDDLCTADTIKAIVNLNVLRRIREDTNIARIDWCGFIHKYLQGKSEPNTLMYLDSTKFDKFPVIRQRPAIRNWTTTAMSRRQELEIEEQVIGKLDLYGEWTESKLDQTEGFYDVGENVSHTRTSYVPPTDKKPRTVQPITAVCPQRVVTRSSPKESVVKPPSYLNSPYMNKRTKVIPLSKRLDFVLGNSLFAMQGDKYETIFQACFGHDVSSVRLNMETLAPRLWIDTNVIDCWVAILNHEELVKDKAIIEGTIDEEQHWKVFSDEISEQFKHDVSSISLFEVDLAFFPIYASGHFYVVVFHLKSPSAMIILDNSDYEETYNSKYNAVCRHLKKESAAKEVGNKDGVNVEKDVVNVVQEGEDDVNEEPQDMLEEETLTQ
nr:hypothetical protein [Tanacetum cinerariifolium]